MTCKRNRLKNLSLIVVPALTLVSLIGATSPVFASSVVVVSNGSAAEEKLEELATTYTNVYFALGVCDGFIAPEEEAPFDPFGPALEKWPDSRWTQPGSRKVRRPSYGLQPWMAL